MRGTAVTLAVLLGMAGGCRTGRDYPANGGPRYAGGPSGAGSVPRLANDTLRLATFNIKLAHEVDSAIVVLRTDPQLRLADVLMLQEMDAESARRIADSLGMWYVSYPAIVNRSTRRDVGNAVLSRWPIVADARIVLPHPSRYAGTHRIATAATIRVGDMTVRVYSTHLGTMMDVGGTARRAQLRTILRDAERFERVVIGGDMNEVDVGRVARESGYLWPTEDGPRTFALGRYDHIFLKGLATADSAATGTVLNVRGASDHLPVWVIALILRP